MTTAVFVSETKAILMAEKLENARIEVSHTNVQPIRRRGEMQGYIVKVKWSDGVYDSMTEDQVEQLEAM